MQALTPSGSSMWEEQRVLKRFVKRVADRDRGWPSIACPLYVNALHIRSRHTPDMIQCSNLITATGIRQFNIGIFKIRFILGEISICMIQIIVFFKIESYHLHIVVRQIAGMCSPQMTRGIIQKPVSGMVIFQLRKPSDRCSPPWQANRAHCL